MNEFNLKYKGHTYIGVELKDFETLDGCKVNGAIFIEESFNELAATDNSTYCRMLDNEIYGFLPRDLIERKNEQEIREYIKVNIG